MYDRYHTAQMMLNKLKGLPPINFRSYRGHDHMVVGFTTTCAINVYHHENCEFKPNSWRGVLNTTLYDKVCQ